MAYPLRTPGGAAASYVFAVRLNPAERECLEKAARAASVEPREHFRAWIAGGARIAPPEASKRGARTAAAKRKQERSIRALWAWIDAWSQRLPVESVKALTLLRSLESDPRTASREEVERAIEAAAQADPDAPPVDLETLLQIRDLATKAHLRAVARGAASRKA